MRSWEYDSIRENWKIWICHFIRPIAMDRLAVSVQLRIERPKMMKNTSHTLDKAYQRAHKWHHWTVVARRQWFSSGDWFDHILIRTWRLWTVVGSLPAGRCRLFIDYKGWFWSSIEEMNGGMIGNCERTEKPSSNFFTISGLWTVPRIFRRFFGRRHDNIRPFSSQHPAAFPHPSL